MALGYGDTVFPQYDYGQGEGAWNPASGSLVYRRMEQARFVPSFALTFCMDILFGKERSGDQCYFWSSDPVYGTDAHGESVITGYTFTRLKHKTRGSKGNGWLYNDNTLNASRSGVPQMFGPPAAKSGGMWRYAVPCTTMAGDPLPAGVPQFTFVIDSPVEDGAYLRMLDAGHAAFVARDHYGTAVCVPYALHWEPRKQRRGRPECGDSKTRPVGSFYR